MLKNILMCSIAAIALYLCSAGANADDLNLNPDENASYFHGYGGRGGYGGYGGYGGFTYGLGYGYPVGAYTCVYFPGLCYGGYYGLSYPGFVYSLSL